MKNIAVIFAGGVGKRMNAKEKPKQFLEIHGKPIVVYTVEVFQQCEAIDGIVVVCVKDWIPYMRELVYRYRLEKVVSVVAGGESGQLSIYNGLKEVEKNFTENELIVLIHDGVRPIITEKIIQDNIQNVIQNGSAITCSPVKETIILSEDGQITVPERDNAYLAKAPQSFFLQDILKVHEMALRDGYTVAVDSCTLMKMYGENLSIVLCGAENIKVTTPEDFYVARALFDARENLQLN